MSGGPTGWKKQALLIERMSADLRISREEVRQLTLAAVRAELERTATKRCLKAVVARLPALTGSKVARFTGSEIREASKRDLRMLPEGDDLTLELVEPSALDVANARPADESPSSALGAEVASSTPDASGCCATVDALQQCADCGGFIATGTAPKDQPSEPCPRCGLRGGTPMLLGVDGAPRTVCFKCFAQAGRAVAPTDAISLVAQE